MRICSARSLLLALTFTLLTSCGVHKWWGNSEVTRSPASAEVEQLLQEDLKSFHEFIQNRLNALHSYYIIGHQNLTAFDQETPNLSPEKLYESESYLNLISVRIQTEEIEKEIFDLVQTLHSQKSERSKNKLNVINDEIAEFSATSLGGLSMENLQALLGHKIMSERSSSTVEVEEEYKKLVQLKEFQVFEKNIEHLSYMLETKIESEHKKIFPDSSEAGNISGNEFPKKVWSLTFDDGPVPDTTAAILEELKSRNLKATFFQLTSQVENWPQAAQEIREAGMEIASHSYTHLQLTKVGAEALEREVSMATKKLEDLQRTKIKFYRLPYGAGLNVPHIRKKIAQTGLIHVFWNVDTLDWMPQTPAKIVARTKALMKKTRKDAGIILFHDIHLRTTKASPAIMDFLQSDKRRTCFLDEIVTQMNEGAKIVCPQN